jgi:predicted  nucleic acid-binding Zn-ribbon protein
MPHRCVKCNTFYEDDAPSVIEGCACGSKAFFFIRDKEEKSGPVLLDMESITTTSEGKYDPTLSRASAGT